MKYTSSTKNVAPLPRSKRKREAARGGTSFSSTMNISGGGGVPTADPNSHTHSNKIDLDKITVEEGYLMTEQTEETDNGMEVLRERARVGYADKAHELDEDSEIYKQFLSRLKEDTAEGHIKFNEGLSSGEFVPGILGGIGANIDNEGHAEVHSLIVRESMTVPELRFNRATVIAGTTTHGPCSGVIKSVTPIDEHSGYAILELGDDDICGSIMDGDLCWGYWHRMNEANATEDADDRKGTIEYKGFSTIYFQIAEVLDEKSTRFRYELKPGTEIHPYAGMTFAGRGNTVHEDRQGFTLITPNYTATYQLVSSWDWGDVAKYIVDVRGRLDGFEEMAGVMPGTWKNYFGSITSNVWMRGTIHQVANDRRFLYITQPSNGLLMSGEVERVQIVIRDTYFRECTDDFYIYRNNRLVNKDEEGKWWFDVNYYELTGEISEITIKAVSKLEDEEGNPLFVLEQKITERKLMVDYHLEVYKTAINPINDIDSLFEFNDGSSVEFDDGMPVATVVSGDSIYAVRMLGADDSEYGELVYSVDDGVEHIIGNRVQVSVESKDTYINFVWYSDSTHTKILSKRIIPIVNAKSSWMIFHDETEDGFEPVIPQVGEDISAKGWYQKMSATSVWMTSKVSVSLLEGAWGEPIRIVGKNGTSVNVKGRVPNREYLDTLTNIQDKDAYITEDTGHLWVYYEGSDEKWIDAGVFKGANGKNAYVHIKYSHDGATFSERTDINDPSTEGETPAEWLGLYADNILEDSLEFGRYTWKKISADVYQLQINKISANISEGTELGFEFDDGSRMDFNDGDPVGYFGIGSDVSVRRLLNGNTTDYGYLYYQFDNEKLISCGNDEKIKIVDAKSITFWWYKDSSYKILISYQIVPIVKNGVSSFMSMVFKRSVEMPEKPKQGSYEYPVPVVEGWSDGIPEEGEGAVWMSQRTFFDDGTESYWSEPSQITDTKFEDFEFSSDYEYTPIPESVHGTDTDKSEWGWTNEAREESVWMAKSMCVNGVWSKWSYTQIKGEKGEDSLVSIVFKRSEKKPAKPEGGSYKNPVPFGWTDGIPSGNLKVWMSKRTFYSDDRGTNDWTDPNDLTDTADFDVCYHGAVAEGHVPPVPLYHHTSDQGNGWHDTADPNDEWMATSRCLNGIWMEWQISKIKGETGNTTFTSFVFMRSNEEPQTPTGGTYADPVPSGWSDGIPTGDQQVWMSKCVFVSDGTSTGWSQPRPMTDTVDFDVCYYGKTADGNMPDPPSKNVHPTQGNDPKKWHDNALVTDVWMATSECHNGVWGAWQINQIKGEKGQSFTKTTNYYQASASNTLSPATTDGTESAGSGWCKTQAETDWSKDKPYLWQCEVETITDNDLSVSYHTKIAHVCGKWGQDMQMTETFAVNNDAENYPASGWTTEVIARAAWNKTKQYLWKRTYVVYVDGSTEYFYSATRLPKQIDFEKKRYAIAKSAAERPSVWYEVQPEITLDYVTGEYYLWTEAMTVYTDKTSYVTYTSVPIPKQGVNGRMLRPRGAWKPNTRYDNDVRFVDVVIYDGHIYSCRDGKGHTSGSTFDASYWEAANEFSFVATDLIMAKGAFIQNLGLNYAEAYAMANGQYDTDHPMFSINGNTGTLSLAAPYNAGSVNSKIDMTSNGLKAVESSRYLNTESYFNSNYVKIRRVISSTQESYATLSYTGLELLESDGAQVKITASGVGFRDSRNSEKEIRWEDIISGFRMVKLSQSQYDALSTKDPNTLYLIV